MVISLCFCCFLVLPTHLLFPKWIGLLSSDSPSSKLWFLHKWAETIFKVHPAKLCTYNPFLLLLLRKEALAGQWRQAQATLCHHLQVLLIFSLQVLLETLSKMYFRLQAKSWFHYINMMYHTHRLEKSTRKYEKWGVCHPSHSGCAFFSQLKSTVFLLPSDHIAVETLITQRAWNS